MEVNQTTFISIFSFFASINQIGEFINEIKFLSSDNWKSIDYEIKLNLNPDIWIVKTKR